MVTRTVFILPGLLEDADGFSAQVDSLREVAAFGVADLTRESSIKALAANALRQAPPGPLSLMGHSMGGYVALEIMRQAPERVERLALLNTNARPDSAEGTENRRRLMALAQKDFPAVIQALLPKLARPENLEKVSGTITEMALAAGKEAFLRQEEAIIGRIDSRPGLAAIRCPTLVIAARDDQLMPVDILKELADGIPGARLAIVEGSGHMASLERPEEVTKLLRDWLG
jgi:pimeloyl-ACP methyl ester carboxylesterase